MDPRLTKSQQKTFCSQLGHVKLQLLYKASIHGFTGAAFHQRCDNQSPTVSVGYNPSGFVFGGYTQKPFSQSGGYVPDDQAFLFTFSAEKLVKYPVTTPAYAVRMVANSGPYFGEDLVLVIGSKAVAHSAPGNYYNFNAAEMHGNDLTLTECEVYKVKVKAGRGGKALPIILCDTMGLEETTGAGLDVDDIVSILKGHLPDSYQFNPSAPLHSDTIGYRDSPGLKDKIHCVAYVIDACKVSIMPTKLEQKLEAIRRKVNLIGIPQLVLMTKVDEACPFVSEDIRNVYKSGYIKEMMQEVSARLGVPLSCIVPVKNYSEELELDTNNDILLLSAVTQMLRLADDYFDEISDRLSNIKTKQ